MVEKGVKLFNRAAIISHGDFDQYSELLWVVLAAADHEAGWEDEGEKQRNAYVLFLDSDPRLPCHRDELQLG